MKQCRKCLQVKSLDSFFKVPRYFLGVLSICKDCCGKQQRKYSKKKRLENKKICKFPKCEEKVAYGRNSYCSAIHNKKAAALRVWARQKANPNYKEIHRRLARKWAKANYIPVKERGRYLGYSRKYTSAKREMNKFLENDL